MVMLNNELTNTTMTCDAACFATMGFAASAKVVVRDLWQHATVATVTASSGWSTLVPANGGSAFVRLTAA